VLPAPRFIPSASPLHDQRAGPPTHDPIYPPAISQNPTGFLQPSGEDRVAPPPAYATGHPHPSDRLPIATPGTESAGLMVGVPTYGQWWGGVSRFAVTMSDGEPMPATVVSRAKRVGTPCQVR